MSGDRIATAALGVTMLAVGAIAWWLQLRPDLVMDTTRLAALPLSLEDWSGEALPLDSGVERMLNADLNLQRAYWIDDESAGANPPVWLYVGYYGTARGGRPEHTPEVCYPSAGWDIDSHRRTTVDPETGPVNELVVSREGYRRLVHFWYRSSDRDDLLGTWGISLAHLRGRLSDGRADGALVRLSTPLDAGGLEAARRRLISMRRPLDAELAARWPDETPRRS